MRLKVIVICLLFAAWQAIDFQKSMAQTLTIDSVLNSIEKNNPELRMYDARIKALDTYATGASSYDPPQVGAGFFYDTL
jgi:hypothetical protein